MATLCIKCGGRKPFAEKIIIIGQQGMPPLVGFTHPSCAK